jgi:hypothetical protein
MNTKQDKCLEEQFYTLSCLSPNHPVTQSPSQGINPSKKYSMLSHFKKTYVFHAFGGLLPKTDYPPSFIDH